jgi:hypothetical protein
MPYDIHVKSPYSTVAEDAAVLTAFNTFVAALQAASVHKVDAGGSFIAGKKVTADETNAGTRRQGDVW